MKIIDEREREKIKDRKKQTNSASYSGIVRAKWFCCAFRSGFVQLIYQASLIFKSFCTNNFVKKILTLSQLLSYFSNKDRNPDDLKSFLVYKFTSASCSSSYFDKSYYHFKTRIEEHIKKDSKSHIFKHLHSTTTWFDLHNFLSFKIIDKAINST